MPCPHLAALLVTLVPSQDTPASPSLLKVSSRFETESLGLATPRTMGVAQDGGRFAVLSVSEAAQGGADLNGDGDALDLVLHLVDMKDGSTTNLGWATAWGVRTNTNRQAGYYEAFGPVRDRRLGFVLSEADQGGVDLNGDGDALDLIASVYDTSTDTLYSSGLSGAVFLADPPWAGIAVQEPQHGDLDGNGFATHDVLHVWNIETGKVTNVGLPLIAFDNGLDPLAKSWHVHTNGSSLLFNVPEWVQGLDANGDGDTTDDVLHVFDAERARLFATGLATAQAPLVGDELEALAVSEPKMNADLDGDGEIVDNVLHLFHEATGEVRILPFGLKTLEQASAAGRVTGDPFEVHGELVVFTAHEGAGDLNGDGDQDDYVALLHDFEAHTTVPLEAAYKYAINEHHVVYEGYEPGAGIDWNGDGDTGDLVLQVYDLATGATLNTGIASARVKAGWGDDDEPILLEGHRIAWLPDEASEGADLNGDGDLDDRVMHLLDASTGEIQNTGITPFGVAMRQVAGHIVFGARKGVTDHRLGVLDTRSGRLAQTAQHLLDLPPPHARTWIFSSDESVAGTDLNGDGDLFDDVFGWGRIPSETAVRQRDL